jgi:hypothetical protein
MSFTFVEGTVPITGRGRRRIESQYREVVETLYHDRKTNPEKTLIAKTASMEEAKALAVDLKRVKFIGANDVTVSTVIGADYSVTFWVNDKVARGPRKAKSATEEPAETTPETPAVKPIRKTATPK